MAPHAFTRTGTVILTGATSGIGEHVAHRLAATFDTLIVQGPEPPSDVRGVVDGLRGNRAVVEYVQADFAELRQVRAAATRICELTEAVDLLINNAGVPGAPSRIVTVDGNERTLQVNHLALILLTVLLRPLLRTGSRIVNVGSGTHRYEPIDLADPNFAVGYSPTSAYYRSKFAVVATSLWMAEQLRSDGIDVITACPGLTDTALIDAMFGRMGAPVERGAENILAALGPLPSGTYIQDGQVQQPSDDARDTAIQRALAEHAATVLDLPGLTQGRHLSSRASAWSTGSS